MSVLLLIVCSFSLSSLTYAQNLPSNSQLTKVLEPNLHLRHYSIDDGLSLSVVTAFAQTAEGFMWIGTEEGLNRFDGYEFQVYKRISGDPDSLPGNMINALYVDSSERLWIATNKGLALKFSGESPFIDIQPPDNLGQLEVTSITEDIYGQIWVASNRGLYTVNIAELMLDPLREQSEVLAQYQSEKISGVFSVGARLYFGFKGCLVGLDLISFAVNQTCLSEAINESDPIDIVQISSNLTDEIWLGTKYGVFKINLLNEQVSHFHQSADLPFRISDNLVQSIRVDSANRVWVATADGLNVYFPDLGYFVSYRRNLLDKNGLLTNDIYALFEDSNGLIWIGTYGAGFHIWNPDTLPMNHYFTRKDVNFFNANNTVHAVVTDLLGNVWIGSFGKGLFKIDPQRSSIQKVVSSNPQVSLNHEIIASLHFDVYDNLWIGTNNELKVLDPEDNFVTSLGEVAPLNDYILNITEDNQGDIWIGTSQKLIKLKGINGKVRQAAGIEVIDHTSSILSSLPFDNFVVNALYEDIDGVVWIGTEEGLIVYQPDSLDVHLFQYDEFNQQSLSANFIQTIYEDTQGSLWIGTSDGLNQLTVKKDDVSQSYFTRYQESNGFVNDSIYGILPAQDESLWLSTSYGLVKFNPDDGTRLHLTEADGLQSNEFNMWASHKSADDELFFGGINGVSSFIAGELSFRTIDSPLKVIDVRVNNRLVNISETSGIEFTQGDDFLTVKVAAINFYQPHRQEYRYRLSGLSDEWIELGKNRVINVFGLEKGHYSLDVQSRMMGREWSSKEINLPIIIQSSFWSTTAAFIIYASLFISFVFAAFYFWMQRVNRKASSFRIEIENKRLFIKDLRLELDRANEQIEISKQEVDYLQKKIRSYDDKLASFAQRDRISQCYRACYFEELIAKEDRYFQNNHVAIPSCCLLVIQISNLQSLIHRESTANVEASISDFSDWIKNYFSGIDLICRWSDDQFMILKAGDCEQHMDRLINLQRLLKNKAFNAGNGRMLRYLINLSVVSLPFLSQGQFVSRVPALTIASDFARYLEQQRQHGLFRLVCEKPFSSPHMEQLILKGIDALIEQDIFNYKDIKKEATTETV